MKLRSLLTYIALFLIGLTITASCTNPATYITTTTDSASSSAGNSAAHSLGFSAWPGWFPWQVAQEQKLFKANKASVALKWFDGYLESINTLTAQQIDSQQPNPK
jgi:NitT/TauT family transport system substrate-binding protein